MGEKYVVRFSLWTRIVHWVHVFAFLGLIYTGLSYFIPQLGFLAAPLGGVKNALHVHIALGVLFVTMPILSLFTPYPYKGLVKAFTWDKDDNKWMLVFPKFFFAPARYFKDIIKIPQGKFKAGQKNNVWLVILFGLTSAVTGFALYYLRELHDPRVLDVKFWLQLVHSLAGTISFSIILGHIYLAIIFPPFQMHGFALWNMVTGLQPAEEAEQFHKKFFDESLQEGNMVEK